MRRMPLFLFLLAVYSGACSGNPSRTSSGENYTETVQAFVGEDVRYLEQSWGYPDRTFTQPDGTKVYGYVKAKRSGMYGEIEPPGLMRYPPHLDQPVTVGDVTYDDRFGWCMIYFVMDKERRIRKVIWTGRCRPGEAEW